MASVALSSKAVGSTVKLKVNGVAKEFIVVHQGKPSSLYDASCDGTWLLMKDIYEQRRWHGTNVNNLENSTIHSYLNGTFLDLFDADIKAQIKQVKLPYRKNGGSGGTDQSGANGLSCKIFLLSGYEVGWTTSDNSYFPVDGAKLSYFTAGTAAANTKRIANYNGAAAYWWLRSPRTPTTPATLGASAPTAVTASATAPSRMVCAPLWYFPLHSWSLMMGRLRRTRPRRSPASAEALE